MNPTYKTGVVLLSTAVLSLGTPHSNVWSYEIETHADMSEKAYQLANINALLEEQLGLSGNKELSRGSFLLQKLQAPVEWLRQGSRDEDASVRFTNHFYDPIYNRGLTAAIQLGKRSHEWGLEAPEDVPGQEFSYRDARRYFRLSLTEPNPNDRERWLAETFYTLGHVIHLIQDMASPAHTRNALHAGWVGPLYLGPPSVVEKYLDRDGVRQGLKFNGYPIPREGFTRPRDFWVEMDANGLPRNGPTARGLSQIINRNFVSEGTNFTAFQNGDHAPEYANPVLNTQDCYDEEVSTQDAEARPVAGLVTFCRNSFTDPNTGALETNPRMTAFSLFSRDLRERGKTVPGGEFSLNALNAWSIGQLTISRAVGYSAGLLDYFFRGKLEVSREPDPASGLPSLRIVNRSPEPLGEGGVLTLYQDNDRGERSPVQGATLTLSNAVPKDNDAAPLYLPIPLDLPEAGLTLVYQGLLGLEQGAVIGQVLREGVVEQIYRGWMSDEWILRTKDGLYVLPLQAVAGLTTPLDRVTWGDRDNQIVAITAPDGAEPYQVLLFELDRPLGSAAVPTTGDTTPSGYPIAVVRQLNRIPLYETLNAIDLKTTATIAIAREVVQYVVSYTIQSTCEWREVVSGSWEYDCTTTVGGDTLTAAQSWSDTLRYEFQLRLSPEQHAKDPGAARPPKYWWTLDQVRADRHGHVVAVVEIAGPQVAPEDIRTIPLREFDQEGHLVESSMSVTLGGDADPVNSPLFRATVVVDLTSGQLLGKTATDALVLDLTERIVVPGSRGPLCVGSTATAALHGGPWDGDTHTYGHGDCQNGSFFGIHPGTPTEIALRIARQEGLYADRVEGLFRDSLAPLGLGINPSPATPSPDPWDLNYRWSADGTTAIALRLPGGPESFWLGEATWKRWFGPTPGRLGLWIVSPTACSTIGAPTTSVCLANWNLKEDTASVIYNETSEAPPFLIMSNAGGVLTVREDPDGWLWIPWRGATTFIPDLNEFDAWDYVMLDPEYLYNVWTGHFHTLSPGLPAQAGPAPLVSGEEDDGEYHVVGR